MNTPSSKDSRIAIIDAYALFQKLSLAPEESFAQGLLSALLRELHLVSAQPSVHVIALTGLDHPELHMPHTAETSDDAFRDHIAYTIAFSQLIPTFPQQVVAIVDGEIKDIACQLVASCDFAICSDTSSFGTPSTHQGIFQSTVGVSLQPLIGTKNTMSLLASGRMIAASQAEKWGLITECIPQADLQQHTDDLLNDMANVDPAVSTIGKSNFYRQISIPQAEAYEEALEALLFARGSSPVMQ